MLKRENEATTYIGSGVAIPHGTSESGKYIIKSGIVMLQYPEGVEFDNNLAYLIIGIAGTGDRHIEILAKLSAVLDNEELLDKIIHTNDPDFIFGIFTDYNKIHEHD